MRRWLIEVRCARRGDDCRVSPRERELGSRVARQEGSTAECDSRQTPSPPWSGHEASGRIVGRLSQDGPQVRCRGPSVQNDAAQQGLEQPVAEFAFYCLV